MDFEEFKDEAANHLEDAGIDSEAVSDEALHGLWVNKVKPHQVVNELRAAGVV